MPHHNVDSCTNGHGNLVGAPAMWQPCTKLLTCFMAGEPALLDMVTGPWPGNSTWQFYGCMEFRLMSAAVFPPSSHRDLFGAISFKVRSARTCKAGQQIQPDSIINLP